MKRLFAIALPAFLCCSGIINAQKKQAEPDCAVFQPLCDSFNAAYKRNNNTLIKIAKALEALLKKKPTADAGCLEMAGTVFRKAAGYCSNYDLYDDGLPLATLAMELLGKTSNKRELANANTVLGVFMTKRGFNAQALSYLERGLEIRKELGNEKDIANSYNNLGAVYLDFSEEDVDKALYYFLLAKPMAEKSKDEYTQAMTFNNLAVCYQRKKILSKANEYYFKTLELTKKINHEYGIANTLSNIGQVYKSMKKFQESISYLKASVTMAEKAGLMDVKKNSVYTLVINYAGLGRADSAEHYMEVYHYLADSLNQLEHKQDLIDVEARFSLGEKKEQIALLEKQQTLQNSLVKQQRRVIWIFSGAMAVILLFAFFLFRSLRQIKNKNKIIEDQKLLVEQKQEEIIDSIKYAARIQKALITNERYIERQLKKLMSGNRHQI